MDSESTHSRTAHGAWDPKTLLAPFYDKWCSSAPTPDFVIDDVWCGLVATLGFAGTVSEQTVAFWNTTLKQIYVGDEGRKKVRMALACLLERDGLLLRIRDVKCPVWWLQGTEDTPFGQSLPAEEIKMFTGSKEATLEIIQGGGHYLNATSPEQVNKRLLEMVNKYKQ
jgi:pimeloyl-ACP methyl ester carboxylesterase